MLDQHVHSSDKPVRFHSSLGNRLSRGASPSPKVLLIQEHEALREALKAILELEGSYDVISTESGPRGLQTFLREQPDLVVIDLELSDRYGVRLVGDLMERSPDVPIILLTRDLAPVTSTVSSVTVVRKPFLSSSLLAEIRNALGKRSVNQASGTRSATGLSGLRKVRVL